MFSTPLALAGFTNPILATAAVCACQYMLYLMAPPLLGDISSIVHKETDMSGCAGGMSCAHQGFLLAPVHADTDSKPLQTGKLAFGQERS